MLVGHGVARQRSSVVGRRLGYSRRIPNKNTHPSNCTELQQPESDPTKFHQRPEPGRGSAPLGAAHFPNSIQVHEFTAYRRAQYHPLGWHLHSFTPQVTPLLKISFSTQKFLERPRHGAVLARECYRASLKYLYSLPQ